MSPELPERSVTRRAGAGASRAVVSPATVAAGLRGALVSVRGSGRRATGFVVDADGYVVTSAQVVYGGGAIEVTLHDGRTVPVTVVRRDASTGVAVLKVDAGRLPVVTLGSSSSVRVGDAVLAVGGRRGERGELTAGTVRATGAATGGDLALDIPSTPNGAGAPLLDSRGEVIGVTVTSVGGPAAAVPIDRVKPVLYELRAGRSGLRPATTASER
jgi:serine protease Do